MDIDQLIKMAEQADPKFLMRSLKKCHHPCIDSFFLNENLRVFVASPIDESSWHELTQNGIGRTYIGIHDHHYNITINPVVGYLYNITFTVYHGGDWVLRHYLCNKEAKNGFNFVGHTFLKLINAQTILRPIYLNALELHTVQITEQGAVWTVQEGPVIRETTNLFTTEHMDLWDASHLYEKFHNREEVLTRLKERLEYWK